MWSPLSALLLSALLLPTSAQRVVPASRFDALRVEVTLRDDAAGVVAVTTVTNTGRLPAFLHSWELGEFPSGQRFQVTLNGVPVAYLGPHVKRAALPPSVRIAPGASRTFETPLTGEYDVSADGTYAITYTSNVEQNGERLESPAATGRIVGGGRHLALEPESTQDLPLEPESTQDLPLEPESELQQQPADGDLQQPPAHSLLRGGASVADGDVPLVDGGVANGEVTNSSTARELQVVCAAITGTTGTFTGTTVGSATTYTSRCNSIAPGTGGQAVVAWTSPAIAGSATFSTCGSSFDTTLMIGRSTVATTCPSNAQWTCVTANDNSCGLQSSVRFTPLPSTTYFILIQGKKSTRGAFTLTWSFAPSSPTATPSPTRTNSRTPSPTRSNTRSPTATPSQTPSVGAGGSVTFSGGCTAAEQADITLAVSNAKSYSLESKTYLSGTPTASLRWTTWFGPFSSTAWATTLAQYTTEYNAFATKTITVDCSCNTAGTYAYVYPSSPYVVYVCGAFWSAPALGTDSKAGTMVHELSHFTVVMGTDDYAYGQSACKALATSNPSQALMNADSHEYFSENTPAQA